MSLTEIAVFFTASAVYTFVVVMCVALVIFLVILMQNSLDMDDDKKKNYWKLASIASGVVTLLITMFNTKKEFYEKKCNQDVNNLITENEALFKPII